MAINQEVIEGGWTQVKGRIRQRWGELSDQELEEARGNVEQLVGLIEQRTGQAREEVESYLEDATADSASTMHKAADAVKSQAGQAAESASDAARAGYIQTQRLIRDRPMESLTVCFGVGLITGVVVGLLLRSK